MQLARVMGTATSTTKHPSMQGWRLLVTQPLAADGVSPDGNPQLAVDHLGAAAGDVVMLTSDGKTTRTLLKSDQTPVRWSVIGIPDVIPQKRS